MTPAQARVHALTASIEMRAGIDSPASIVERAKVFEAYIAAEGLSQPGPAAAAQATPEKASAAAKRK